jgi:hypothetical protein
MYTLDHPHSHSAQVFLDTSPLSHAPSLAIRHSHLLPTYLLAFGRAFPRLTRIYYSFQNVIYSRPSTRSTLSPSCSLYNSLLWKASAPLVTSTDSDAMRVNGQPPLTLFLDLPPIGRLISVMPCLHRLAWPWFSCSHWRSDQSTAFDGRPGFVHKGGRASALASYWHCSTILLLSLQPTFLSFYSPPANLKPRQAVST